MTCDFIERTLTSTVNLPQHPDAPSLFGMAATYRLEVAAFADVVAGRAVWFGATLADGRRVLERPGSELDQR